MATLRSTVKDESNENSVLRLNVADDITDGNITTLITSLEGIIIGSRGDAFLDTSVPKDVGSQALPGEAFAQRETKWLAAYVDDVTGKVYRKEIPTADLALRVSGTDVANLDSGAGLVWKTDWDLFVKSPEGNATTLQSMTAVGRNL